MDGARLYGVLLRALPRSFRDRHADEMWLVLSEHLEERSPAGRALAWAGAARDVLVQAVRLRLRRRRRVVQFGGGPPRGSGSDALVQDVSFALKSLARRPGFATVAVLVLALGIGSTVTVFCAVDGILLRPLPYRDADRIGILWHELGQGGQSAPRVNPLDVLDYRDWTEAFEELAFGRLLPVVLGGPDDAVAAAALQAEAGFLDFLGVPLLHGRGFLPEEDVPGAAPVAILGHRIWMTHFGGRADAIGRSIDLDGEPHRVVGVLPADFRLHLGPSVIAPRQALDALLPDRFDPANAGPRNSTWYFAFARLAQGRTFAEANDELAAMSTRLRELHPAHAAAETRARVVPLKEDVVGDARSGLVLVLGAVALVLLVACANVANLLLTRIRSRDVELGIRSALGAERARIVRLVLAESLVLAAAGGALGVALAVGGTRAVRVLGGELLPRPDAITVNGTVLLFALALSVAAAALAGLPSAVGASSGFPARVIAGYARASASRAAVRLRDALVVVEMSLSVALLVGTGLLLRTFWSLHLVEPGYATEDVVTVPLVIQSAIESREERIGFMRDVTERLAARPGVRSVGIVSHPPLSGMTFHRPYAYDEETSSNWERVTAEAAWVTPGYFEAIGATLLAGRDFTWDDHATVATSYRLVIDDRLAARAFPDGGAVGGSLQIHPRGYRGRVIGVVSHLRVQELTRAGREQMYFLNRGTGIEGGLPTVVVRTALAPETVEAMAREEVSVLASGVAYGEVETIERLTARARGPTRALAVLLSVFGGTALVLSGIGLYGVLAYIVRQRRKEIGIRMALGQSPADVRRVVLRRGVALLGLSVGLGLALAAAVARFSASFLFGVEPVDPATYLAVSAVLGGSGLLASWLPARQATRVDPIEVLKPD